MKKPILILTLLVTICSFIILFYNSNSSKETTINQLAKVSLRLKWLYDPGFAGELIALKNGIFRNNGLDVDIQPGGFETDPIKLVANGSDTFGVTGADSFLLARQNGIPIVAFAAGYIHTAVVFYSHKNQNIQSPPDWKGKRIGVQAGQDTETIYKVLLSKFNISTNDVKEIPIKYDFSQFLNGQVDIWPGYAAGQSFILNQKGIPFNTLKPSDFGVNYLGTVYFTTEKTIREQPELVYKFLKSVIEGWNLAYSNESLAISYISSFDKTTLTDDLVKWTLEKQRYSIKPAGREYCDFRIEDFQNLQGILKKQNLLTKPVVLDKSVSMEFLDKFYLRKSN